MRFFDKIVSCHRGWRCSMRAVAVVAGLFLCCFSPAWSQEPAQAPNVQKGILLSPEKLRACEGFFQSPQNREMVIQFATEGNVLVARLMWINRAFKLAAHSDSTFITVDSPEGRPIPVKFIRDKQGILSQAMVNNSDVWIRANVYKPLVRMEIGHTPAELKVFEGTYELGTGAAYLQITEKDNKLILKQYWDGREIEFVPDSAAHFFCKDQILFTLRFLKDKNGEIIAMLAFNRDMWNKTKRVDFTAEPLKQFEGKYQLKDDRDDLIQIIARDGRLVIKQVWDGKETVVEHVAENFFVAGGSYTVNFDKDKDGNIGQVVILGTDVFEKVKE
jgi:hypothetical protein